ncbi:hypothetical protein [Paenibacillus sp. IITD108]|uniref:hypothetical protein n=1 Tax=Paenibacillus sp. IITD108 TaxID=3116649 RepID=UPI002F42D476
MNIIVKQTDFRGSYAILMESAAIKLIVLPQAGGSIVSLQYKETGKEWLVNALGEGIRQASYGDTFSEEMMHGWDECFPTIDACHYPLPGSYEHAHLPDHGELWSVPWTYSMAEHSLVTETSGKALPYSFTRTISFIDEQTLRFSYLVRNPSEEPITAFWCAHPLFSATEHTQIRLPPELDSVLCVVGGKRYEKGKSYKWNQGAVVHSGMAIDRLAPISAKDSRKFYAGIPFATGLAGLYEQDTGEFVQLSWLVKELPYFGLWINEGHYNDKLMVALEPCNGFYDSLDEAHKRKKTLLLEPGASASWSIHVKLGVDYR